ncbi:hypothetical protein [Streptomyces sp. NPDC003077]|uniref:hypothetical protein n=1 Tax=Streptomyces sp. NPDC003077 TaxID=3154443 RepID=UPI0033B5E146
MFDAEDVMGVITQQVENRFRMPLDELRRAVTAAPQANREATATVHWYGLLAQAQAALERAEDALVEALGTEPGELADPVMDLAQQVNAAVAVRDGRAVLVQYLLDPDASNGRRGRQEVHVGGRQRPALTTTPPTLPATATVPVPGAMR